MAYGSPEQVAGFAQIWTDNGEFKNPDICGDEPGTVPTLARVEEWLEQVSDLIDLSLGEYGFSFPVTPDISENAAKFIRILDMKASALVADLVHLSHDTGRLFTDRIRETGEEASTILERELLAWVKKRINSIEAFGIPRSIDEAEGSSYSVPAGRQL